ncbi:Sulfotransferase domain [Chlorella sorokiniana]|uniref:Sulfotransferase domain n=1 Tax=Chlorella sorokiniana TaxID=3076 RepID=A0A2P6TR15_CHLSO|nr:Sulfotransferase domain [Chlorella sorokiniana]|eukprot:PRW56512.1 Sulfotransferase domain [Chlorella sorokiniana]
MCPPYWSTKGQGAIDSIATGQPPFSFVIMSSSHKTGTVQLLCLARVVRDVAGVALSTHTGNATSAHVAAAIAAADPQPGNPAMLMSVLPLNQECFGRADGGSGPPFRCPRPDVPCNPDGTPRLSTDGCYMHLPATDSGALGLVHFVRNPWDVVVSAYWYHLQTPAPETWIDKPLSTRLGMMREAGVPPEQLAALGTGEEQAAMSYGDTLRALPDEAGVQLEFWRSAEGLYAMARQYRLLRHQPAALQLPYEGAQAAFNDTVRRIAGQFWPQQHAGRILGAAQQCDPTTWSAAQLTTNNHVTAAKHSAADRQRLQGVLAAQPEIRRHLCVLAAALGYADDPRCRQQPEQAQQGQQQQQAGQPSVVG